MRFDDVTVNYTPTYQYVKLPTGIRMSYVELGAPEGETVVLIHGAIDCYISFSQVGAYLASLGYHVYIPELRGHGNTDKPDDGPYTVELLTDDLIGFMEAVEMEGATAVGHSLGSLIVQQMAAKRPALVRTVVLMGTSCQAKGATMDYLLDGDGEFAGLRNIDRLEEDWVHEFLSNTNADPEFREEVNKRAFALPFSTWIQTFEGLDRCDNRSYIEAIRQPTMIIWGSEDDFFEKDSQDYVMTHLDADIVLFLRKSGSTHDVHWCGHMGREIAEDIDRFITDVKETDKNG